MVNNMTYSEQVIELIQSGNLDAVDETIQQALALDDEETLHLLGNTLYQLGFLNETKKVYNYLIELNPTDDELKIYLAEISIEEGNDVEALEILHSIEETSPAYPQALLVEADYYLLNDLPEVSLQKLEEANDILPNEPVIQFALAEVYFTISDFKNAINYYESLSAEGFDEIAGTLLSARLGNAYLMTGKYKESANYLKEALSLKDDPEMYYQLGFVYFNQEQYDKAIDSFDKAKVLDPTLIAIYLLQSEAHEKLNQLEEAVAVLEEAITMNEMSTELYLAAAELATKSKQYELAEKYYQEAVKLEPDNDQVVIKYAHYLSFMDDHEGVIELFERSVPIIQQNPDANWLLARANNMIEEYDKAREFYNLAYAYLAEDLDFLKDFIFFLREDGQRDKMRELAEKYMTLNPEVDNEIVSLLDDIYDE